MLLCFQSRVNFSASPFSRALNVVAAPRTELLTAEELSQPVTHSTTALA